MLKKALSLVLVFVCAFVFVACGNDATSSGEKDDSSLNQTSSNNVSETSSNTSSDTLSNTSSNTSSNISSNTPSNTSSNTLSNTSSNTTVVKMEEPKFPVSKTALYTHEVVRYEINNQNKGYYFTPKAKGKYPTLILIHGKGGVNTFQTRVLSSFQKWVKDGYLPPMVVVIPEVYDYNANGYDIDDFQLFVHKSHSNRFTTLLKKIQDGSLSPQIDTSIQPYVAGFSMGGMASLHIGVEFNTSVKKVGALSPSASFYLGEGKWGFYNYKKDIHFSSDPDALVYLACGQGEGDGVKKSIQDFENAIGFNDPDISTKYLAPASWGDHAWPLAQKQIFMFLYLATFNELPSTKLVENQCHPDVYTAPKITWTEETHT